MVAHVGALHDHVHVVQVGKDRILQALTVVGADRFQNIRVLLNDRFFCLMMDGEQTCPAIMYILRTGMLQHELTVGQRIEDMVEIFIQTEHGCNVIHCAGGPLLFHNGAQIRIDRSKCAGIERFQTDMGFQNFAQVAGLLHLLAVNQADKASPFGEHIHSTIGSQAMQCFTHGNTAAFKLGSKAHLVDIMDGTFVPNFGMSVRELEMIRRITDAGHHKLVDCHMMVMNPHRYIKRIAEAGADIIYIHPESELIPSATLELIQLEGKKTGLILNPCTSLETVKDMLPITDYVMIMAVNPGFAGREFMPYTRQKFIELDNYRKEKGLNYHLMLDGGATREVIADLYHNCNVEGFVLGKQELFFQQDDYATCIDRIRTF